MDEVQEQGIGLTILAPACDERGNIETLVRRVGQACAASGLVYEFIVVDDASADGTPDAVLAMQESHPWVRLVRLDTPRTGVRRSNGQSAAFHAGIRAARGRLIATIDADLQNDPGDLPAMIERLAAEGADLVQGDRTALRGKGDHWVRQFGSGVGRAARRTLLADPTVDTGCSLRVMTREVAMGLPLHLRGMHRFIPVMARTMGGRVIEVPVSHAPRHAGQTKYGMGIWSRAIPGLIDCLIVRWMMRRWSTPNATEYGSGGARADQASEGDRP